MDKTMVAINLRLIAAMAEKMTEGVESGQLWPGELDEAIAQIRKWLAEVEE